VYPLEGRVTVLDAINTADGLRLGANRILVLHGNVTIRLKYKRLLEHLEENIVIENGDHIIIP